MTMLHKNQKFLLSKLNSAKFSNAVQRSAFRFLSLDLSKHSDNDGSTVIEDKESVVSSLKSSEKKETSNAGNWLKVSLTPRFAKLSDVLRGLDQFSKNLSESPSSFKVTEARHLMTSNLLLKGYYLKFESSDDCAAVIEEHVKKDSPILTVGWKPCYISAQEPNFNNRIYDDRTLRVETNNEATITDIEALFSRFGLRANNAVEFHRVKSKHQNVFLVNFDDASEARIAMVELNSQRVRNGFIRMFQFPDLNVL